MDISRKSGAFLLTQLVSVKRPYKFDVLTDQAIHLDNIMLTTSTCFQHETAELTIGGVNKQDTTK